MNLLFICEGNTQRSPTFERWFKKNRPNINVKSTGTTHGYPERMRGELLDWATHIYLMDLEQLMFMERKFPQYIHKSTVIGVSDQYPNDSPQLIRLINYWVKRENL